MQDLKKANAEAVIEFNETEELNDIFQDYVYEEFNPSEETEELRFIDAISEGLKQSMQRHENLVLMGQDIAEYGGVFKITEGFVEEFGRERVTKYSYL